MRESPNYVLSGTEADAETSRLSLLEQVSDPSTMSVLARLGVRLGWRCLDVGAGHGSISRRLAEIVGPEGRVVAADIDLSHLDTGGYDNVSMRELDVAADDLGGEYDLVHARHLLVHVPNAELVVRRLVTALAPGGRLVAADAVLDPDPPIGEAPEVYRKFVAAWTAALGARGEDANVARRLPYMFEHAGLEDVTGEGVYTITDHPSPALDILIASVDALAPTLLETGLIESDDIEELHAGLGVHHHFNELFHKLTVWGRKPVDA